MFICPNFPVQLSLPIPNDPLSNKSNISLQSSLIYLAIFLFSTMLVSHTMSMIFPLIFSVTKRFGIFDTSSFYENTTAFWKVALVALASFSLKIILSRALLTY
jgi:hypothetical protein